MSWNSRIVGSDMVDPSILCPNPKNWRRHPKHQQDAMTNVFNEIGWIQDIIVNKTTGNIIDGHMRAELAVKNKEKLVPVKYVDLTADEERQALISYDPLSALAEQDNEMLKQLLGDISNNIDMSKFDFGKDVLNSMRPHTDEEINDVPPVPDTPTTKLGDIYHLGNHVLMCGDSTSAEDVRKLMDGKKADMIFTDPPYGVDYVAMRGGDKIANDSNADDAYHCMVSALGCIHTNVAFVCCSWRSLPITIDAMLDANLKPKACIVWDKEHGVQNLDRYYKQHEFIIYAGPYGGEKTVDGDIWKIPRDFKPDHPTPKPVALPSRAIYTASSHGQLVADPFLGSGSTLIACEQLNRVCYGMELSPQYCDVIINRWEKLTGKKAELVSEVD